MLGVNGDHFTVNGEPGFLVFVSYFDAMDASPGTLESDLEFLKGRGVDGIRIFADWWACLDCPSPFDGDTVVAPDGSLRTEPLRRLQHVLGRARSRGLVVDLSFSWATISDAPAGPGQATKATVLSGLQNLTKALDAPEYDHVLFDLQNESDLVGPGTCGSKGCPMSVDELARLRQAVAAIDPGRIVTVSTSDRRREADAVRRATIIGVDVLAFHDRREADFFSWERMRASIEVLRQSGKPVYFQEPQRLQRAKALTAGNLAEALANAKRAGAAAWCFHTDAGFALDNASFAQQLRDTARTVESEFLNGLRKVAQDTPWGIARK